MPAAETNYWRGGSYTWKCLILRQRRHRKAVIECTLHGCFAAFATCRGGSKEQKPFSCNDGVIICFLDRQFISVQTQLVWKWKPTPWRESQRSISSMRSRAE